MKNKEIYARDNVDPKKIIAMKQEAAIIIEKQLDECEKIIELG